MFALDALTVLAVAVYFGVDLGLTRVDALVNWRDRPRDRPAQDWLLVGTDRVEPPVRRLPGDGANTRRADTIMFLHIPADRSKPTLVILPPDLGMTIPEGGRRFHRLDTIYAMGGPRLLAQTVESFTWLRIDRYLEFSLADLIDAIGGIRICGTVPDTHRCQNLTGPEAVGRIHGGDREPRRPAWIRYQRDVVETLIRTAMAPRTYLDPLRAVAFARIGLDSVTLGKGDHLHNLIRLAATLRGIGDGGVAVTTAPIVGSAPIPADGAHWDWDKTRSIFAALQTDHQVPRDLLAD